MRKISQLLKRGGPKLRVWLWLQTFANFLLALFICWTDGPLAAFLLSLEASLVLWTLVIPKVNSNSPIGDLHVKLIVFEGGILFVISGFTGMGLSLPDFVPIAFIASGGTVVAAVLLDFLFKEKWDSRVWSPPLCWPPDDCDGFCGKRGGP